MAGFGELASECANDVRRKRVRGITGGIVNTAIMGVLLFVPAGTLEWPMAGVLLVFSIVSFTANTLLVSPALIDERSRRHEDAKPWDRYLVASIVLFGFLSMIVAGLDFRFGWTHTLPPVVQGGAFIIVILSGVLVIWAAKSNPFFSAVVRIQNERGHTVVSSGPYRYVRHPGYAGWVLYMLSLPLMLGSAWALVPGATAAALDIVRTYLEDQVLVAELPGYREYAVRVQYRLIPGMW